MRGLPFTDGERLVQLTRDLDNQVFYFRSDETQESLQRVQVCAKDILALVKRMEKKP